VDHGRPASDKSDDRVLWGQQHQQFSMHAAATTQARRAGRRAVLCPTTTSSSIVP